MGAGFFQVGNTLTFPLLTIVLFLPGVAAVVATLWNEERIVRTISVVAAVADFILAAALLVMFKYGGTGANWRFQFADKHDWIPTLGITYWIGVDGVSIWLIALTTLMTGIAILAAQFMLIDRLKVFLVFMLALETAILGVFMSLNVFLFFVFWEAMLIPTYFLLGIWGEERRIYATMKFLVYTVFGSFLMLVGIFYLWSQTGTLDMVGPNGLIAHPLDNGSQDWLFLAFAIAFAIKLPVWPFHTWAPTAYAESPVPFTIVLSGLLSKAGAFGFIRYCLPLFPHASRHFAPLISILCIIGMIYAAGLALVQTDIKRLVAYSSVSHMNLIGLGIFALNTTALDGSVLQMINHSVIISSLFLAVAYIAARTGTRMIPNLGGMGRGRPWLMWLFFVFVLAGLDLPGTSSFAGEFLILAGTFRQNAWFASIASITVIMAAWYMIRFWQDTMNGPVTASPEQIAATVEDETKTVYQYPVLRHLLPGDLRLREGLLWVPLLALVLYIGVQPHLVTQRMDSTNSAITRTVHTSVPSPVLGAGR